MCDDKGVQREMNLTPSQQLGLKSLTRKVSRLEIVLLESDNGKPFFIVDEGTYLNMAQDHTSKDAIMTPAEVRRSQKIPLSTANVLGNIVNIGSLQLHSGYRQCMDNLGSEENPFRVASGA